MKHIVSKLPIANRIKLGATSKSLRKSVKSQGHIGPTNYYPPSLPAQPTMHIGFAKARIRCCKRILADTPNLFGQLHIPRNDQIRSAYEDENVYGVDLTPYYPELIKSIKNHALASSVPEPKVTLRYDFATLGIDITIPKSHTFPYDCTFSLDNFVDSPPNEVRVFLGFVFNGSGFFLNGNGSDSVGYDTLREQLDITSNTPTAVFRKTDDPTKGELVRMAVMAKLMRVLRGGILSLDYESSDVTSTQRRALKAFLTRFNIL